MEEIKVQEHQLDQTATEMKPIIVKINDEEKFITRRDSGHKLTKQGLIKTLILNAETKGQKLCEIDGILSLIVDKQCISDEEGMRELISLLQKNKSKIQGIVIQDFGGTFKVDYLKRIELTLREAKKLRLIVIHNSNLNREHIQILRNIIWWRKDQLEKIYLNKNSIDSFDFTDLFVSRDFNFTDLKNLKMLEIKVQPGINKLTKNQFSEFTNLLTKNNIQLTSKKNSREGLYISLDETSLNNQNRKLLRQSSDTLSSIHLEETNTQKLFYTLNLGGCFSDKNEGGLRYLGEYLIGENFDDITDLSFRHTTLKTPENWIPICSFLKRTKTILNIDLSSCSLNDKIVINLFSQTFSIKQIDISDNNNIQLAGWKKIFESLICNHASVTDSIRMDNCYFEDEEIVTVGNMINSFNNKVNKSRYNCPLTKFYFNFNTKISENGWKNLLTGIFKLASMSLERIELRGCDLDNGKLQAINEALRIGYSKGGQLEEIVLRNNPSLGDKQELCNLFEFAFINLKNFKKFDLSNCNLTDDILSQIFMSYSKSNQILTEIVLKNNPNIGRKSYKLLAESFIFNERSSLIKIDISGNHITKEKFSDFLEIAKDFISSGKKNNKLLKFILNQSTSFDDDTFKQIVDLFLFSNQSINLQKLSLMNSLTQNKIKIICNRLTELEQKNESLNLKQIGFDKNPITSPIEMVMILEAFLLKSQTCPKLEILTFSYCNLWNHQAKLLYQKLKAIKTSPSNLKKLSLKGNVSLTSDGWTFLSYVLFQSGILANLESLDISYCQLEETSMSTICLSFAEQNKTKPADYVNPLKELTLNNNPQLESYDWQNIFESMVFSKNSSIKTLNASNCNFDQKSMEMFIDGIRKFKMQLEKEGFIEDTDRHQLVNLNISQNNQIDENTWKQFISVYVLNKSSETDFEQEYKQQVKFEQEDAQLVKDKFSNLEHAYKQKLEQFKVTGKLPLFNVQHLDLKGTGTLDGYQWSDIFSLLIINERSHLEFLGLSQTYIEPTAWESIFKLMYEYTHRKAPLLKLKTIEFNDNQYLSNEIWGECIKNLFFDNKLLELKTLELNNCKLNTEILKWFKELPQMVNLEVLSIRRNPQITELHCLGTRFKKIHTIHCDQSEIAAVGFPQSVKNTLEVLTVKLNDNNVFEQITSFCEEMTCLTSLNLRNSANVTANTKSSQLLDIFRDSFKQLSAHNQVIDSDTIFELIVTANSIGKNLNNIDLSGAVIKPLSADKLRPNKQKEEIKQLGDNAQQEGQEQNQSEQKQEQKQDDKEQKIAEINVNEKGDQNKEEEKKEEKSHEQKKKEGMQLDDEIRKEWDIVLEKGYFSDNKNIVNQTLTSINISSTTGTAFTEIDRDSIATEYILRYAAQHCSSLQELNISNCFMSEKAFQAFCHEYKKNPSISIKKLDVSNNQQLKTESWKVFFECVLFQKKSQFDYLNLGKNLLLKEEFEILRKLSVKFSSSNFYIKKLSMKSLQKSVEGSVWVHCFFMNFIKSQNRKVEKIYLNDSLGLDAQNTIVEFLTQYVQNSSCKIEAVYGYYEIVQIFKKANPKNFPVLNIPKELHANSQFAVIDMWKQGLVSDIITTIKNNNSLTEDFVNGIPRMSLDLIQDFFEPMNLQFARNSKPKEGQIFSSDVERTTHILSFDYESIKYISKYFSREGEQNESNPQTVILNDLVRDYFMKPRIFKYIYFIPHRYFDGTDTQQLYQLFLKFKDTKVDSIIIDYDLRQVDLDPNLSERRLINFIRMFPPKSLELTNVSINALKAIYSIVSSNENYRYANVNFSSQSFINNGIAFSLREKLYMGKKNKNFIVKFFNSIAYFFLDLFCVEADNYKFDKTIPILNNSLKTQRKYFNIMILLTIIYYAICIFVPYLFTVEFGVYVKTKKGVAWQSHYFYAAFAAVSFIVEVIIYSFAYHQIKHLLPKMIDVENVDNEDMSMTSRVKRYLQKKDKLLEWISYIIQLVLSQVDRFDLYSDMCFIVICMKMEQYVIGFISLGVFANHLLVNIFKLFIFIHTIFVRDSRRLLNTNEINSFCELSNLVEFEALNNVLDTVAPYNISFIPNWYLFRKLAPNVAGQSISNRLMNSMQKFLFEDILQITLQAAYVVSQNEGTDLTVILSIISSVISLTKAFYKFMSTRPTTISQLDFDYLSKIKKQGAKKYSSSLVQYRDNMLSNLQYSVDKYTPNSIVNIKKLSVEKTEKSVPPPSDQNPPKAPDQQNQQVQQAEKVEEVKQDQHHEQDEENQQDYDDQEENEQDYDSEQDYEDEEGQDDGENEEDQEGEEHENDNEGQEYH